MATITVKNIPDSVYLKLKELARIRHRSLNGEIISCLEQAVGLASVKPAEIRLRAEAFREKIGEAVKGQTQDKARTAK